MPLITTATACLPDQLQRAVPALRAASRGGGAVRDPRSQGASRFGSRGRTRAPWTSWTSPSPKGGGEMGTCGPATRRSSPQPPTAASTPAQPPAPAPQPRRPSPGALFTRSGAEPLPPAFAMVPTPGSRAPAFPLCSGPGPAPQPQPSAALPPRSPGASGNQVSLPYFNVHDEDEEVRARQKTGRAQEERQGGRRLF